MKKEIGAWGRKKTSPSIGERILIADEDWLYLDQVPSRAMVISLYFTIYIIS
jgi:hypothetical protein